MAPSGGNNPPSTCLFLPELPPDLSDSILERHFRGFVGFSSSRTRKDRNGKLVGFVEFEQIDDAVRCRDSMGSTSPFPGLNWHIHFSNNTKGGPPNPAPKRPRDEPGPPVPRHDAQRPSYGAPGGCARRSPLATPLATPLSLGRCARSRACCDRPLRVAGCRHPPTIRARTVVTARLLRSSSHRSLLRVSTAAAATVLLLPRSTR